MNDRENYRRWKAAVEAAPYLDFRGHRYYPPYHCLCCGVEIAAAQFAWGRYCGYCDTGKCQTRLGTWESGHGRSDIVAQAEVIDLADWCASMECEAHKERNRTEILRRRRKLGLAVSGNE